MKNIPHSALLVFYGMSSEDPNTFLFEFFVIFISYDYVTDQQKMKIFPSTLKNQALRWLMGLEGDNITIWAHMKKLFLDKYQEYYKDKDRKESIFKMT